jgi:hypothetical protein
MQENVSVGEHSFQWNGKTIEGKGVGSVMALLRLSTPSGSLTRNVFMAR